VLLVITVLLVLAGLVLLLVGFAQDSLSLIYLSIGCAAAAGVAFVIFGRLSRRRTVRWATGLGLAASAPTDPGSLTEEGPARVDPKTPDPDTQEPDQAEAAADRPSEQPASGSESGTNRPPGPDAGAT
jgi:hypothetical protein